VNPGRPPSHVQHSPCHQHTWGCTAMNKLTMRLLLCSCPYSVQFVRWAGCSCVNASCIAASPCHLDSLRSLTLFFSRQAA
jgi:putative lipase involved disintegration of autophagic bodies